MKFPVTILHGACMGLPVPRMVHTRQYHAWNMPVPCMEYACTMHEYASTTHGICLYHTWNTPVPPMEYASSTHEIFLYHAWNMPVPCMEYDYISMKRA